MKINKLFKKTIEKRKNWEEKVIYLKDFWRKRLARCLGEKDVE